MLIIERPQTDPYFNIAAEEYLFKKIDQDCFMLWQNEPSVIIGKHQNTNAEINIDYVHRYNMPVIRRISGGGTVYHDLGNLNFTFISIVQNKSLVDFSKFLMPIIDALNFIGIPARLDGKSDIRVNGLKISGNSQHVFKNKVLHHGTLLFNADIAVLNEVLKTATTGYTDKAVQSKRSKVTNIIDYIKVPVSIYEFRRQILNFMIERQEKIENYCLTEEDITGIQNLADIKYKTPEWNYAYSPQYTFKKKAVYHEIEYITRIMVKNGVIIECEISAARVSFDEKAALVNAIKGLNHNQISIKEEIFRLSGKAESLNFDPNILLELLF